MSDDDAQTEKRKLRFALKERLARATPVEALEAGRALADRMSDLPAWRTAARVGLFVSRSDEIDTSPLAHRVVDACKVLLLPRMADDRRLEFVPVDDFEDLVPGAHGILEPPARLPATHPVAEDLLCLPGLAFDRAGGRLGRGGGYYDRTFAGASCDPARPRWIGIGYSFQLVAKVPMTERDLRLDGVVTDRETVEVAIVSANGIDER